MDRYILRLGWRLSPDLVTTKQRKSLRRAENNSGDRTRFFSSTRSVAGDIPKMGKICSLWRFKLERGLFLQSSDYDHWFLFAVLERLLKKFSMWTVFYAYGFTKVHPAWKSLLKAYLEMKPFMCSKHHTKIRLGDELTRTLWNKSTSTTTTLDFFLIWKHFERIARSINIGFRVLCSFFSFFSWALLSLLNL